MFDIYLMFFQTIIHPSIEVKQRYKHQRQLFGPHLIFQKLKSIVYYQKQISQLQIQNSTSSLVSRVEAILKQAKGFQTFHKISILSGLQTFSNSFILFVLEINFCFYLKLQFNLSFLRAIPLTSLKDQEITFVEYSFFHDLVSSVVYFWHHLNSNIMDNRRSMERIASSRAQNYKYNQIFGYKGPGEKIMEEDIISVLKYDTTGRFLALGDNAGRVIIFQSEAGKQKEEQLDYFTQFQSHIKEFDPLRSMQIEETITGLHWLSPQGKYQKIVSTNSKNIKLWKIFEKPQKKVVRPATKDLNVPKLQTTESYYSAHISLAFPNKHLSGINSISGTKNQEYLLSSDEVHAYLWNYEKYQKPYIVADMMGSSKIEDVQENITFSKMHPTADNLLIYGTNKGTLKLCDMRISSNSDTTAANFKNQYPGQKNFLTDFLTSYCSADFGKQGKYIVSRDYLTVKVWDVCNSKKPINTINLNEAMKSKLSEVFQNQAIYDKFNVSCSPDGNTIASGTYNNCFHLADLDGTNTQFELNYKKLTLSKNIVGKPSPLGKIDYLKKTTALDFHPLRNTVAVASLNCFFLYSM